MDHDAAPTLDVALVTETYPPEVNGVSMTLKRVVDGCRALGHRVTVIRPRQASSRPVADEWSHPGFPLPGYRGLQMGYPRRAVLQARWRIAPPDVVHVATEGPLGLCAMRAARRLGIPVTSSFHTNYHAYAGHYGCRLLGPAMSNRRRSMCWSQMRCCSAMVRACNRSWMARHSCGRERSQWRMLRPTTPERP